MREHGADVWFEMDAKELLRGYGLPKCQNKGVCEGKRHLDVGSTPA